MRYRSDIHEGMIVRSLDGEKLGKVTRLFDDGFEVEKGFFFPKEYSARYEEISDIRNDEVYLSAGRSAFEGYRTRGSWASEAERIPLAEEELTAEKSTREGEVRIHKDVTTERRDISVPVTKETVRVEREPVSGKRPAERGEATFKEGTVTIPVTEEEVEIKKRPVVREQVVVKKERHEEQRTASGDVRKENVTIEEDPKKRRW